MARGDTTINRPANTERLTTSIDRTNESHLLPYSHKHSEACIFLVVDYPLDMARYALVFVPHYFVDECICTIIIVELNTDVSAAFNLAELNLAFTYRIVKTVWASETRGDRATGTAA